MPNGTKFEVSHRLFLLLLIFLVGFVAFFGFRASQMWNEISGEFPREITIEAEGKTYVVPDIATINLGVSSRAKTVEDVTNENIEKMNKVLEEIKNIGIEEKDIRTTGFSLRPEYFQSEERGRVLIGYQQEQSFYYMQLHH